MSYSITSSLNKYFIENEGVDFHCYGSKQDCWSQISKGSTQSAFGKNNFEGTHVSLKPNIKKIISCKNLDFLSNNITHLRVPLPLVKNLNYSNLPKLKNLTIYNQWDYLNNFSLEDCKLDSNFDLNSFVYSGLHLEKESLLFGANAGIDLNNYRSLEYLSMAIGHNLEIKRYLHTLNQVKYFSLGAGSEDIIEFIPIGSLVYLDLGCDNRIIEFSKLSRLKNIQNLSIRDTKSTFNCSYLRGFNTLKELSLFDIRSIENIEVLLELPKLTSLEIKYCGLNINKDKLRIFKEHGFSHLEIINNM